MVFERKRDFPNASRLYLSANKTFKVQIEKIIAYPGNARITRIVDPWEYWMAIFTTIPDGHKKFARFQIMGQNQFGFIFAMWNREGWIIAPDEAPNIHTNLGTASKLIIRTQQKLSDEHTHIGLAPWCLASHPNPKIPVDLQVETGLPIGARRTESDR